MIIKIMLDEGAILPTRAHRADAGLDLYTPHDVLINGGCSAEVDTGVHMEIPFGFFGDIRSRSGLLFKNNIFTDGTIDSGYTGSIRVKVLNLGHQPVLIMKGNKIAQIVISGCELPELVPAKELGKTERGDNGFGSTGR
ncbi:MAG: dUTP diphosphatase [Oscillospiraceae bacterium]|nr:dUTP diphosphatase [Oscillospiraceae bacterium]